MLVRNPQPEDITIAVVTVDDAIVPFTTDGPQTIERLRSTTLEIPYTWVEDDPYTVGVTSSSGIQTTIAIPAAVATPGIDGGSIGGYAPHRVPGRGRAGRARHALAAVAAACRSALARRLHGAHRRPAHLPRDRRPLRGAGAAGRPARRARRPRPGALGGGGELPRPVVGWPSARPGAGPPREGARPWRASPSRRWSPSALACTLGIAAPIAEDRRVRLRQLAGLALIAGAPAILGA